MIVIIIFIITVNIFTFQRLGVHFTEYHSESMYHGKSLEVIGNLRKLGFLKVDE